MYYHRDQRNSGREGQSERVMDMKNVLVAVTASIAGYKACEVISAFRKKGYNVKCMMTRGAEKFVTELALETLSGNKVVRDIFSLSEKSMPEHISLAESADVIVIVPATADIIAKTACGICDEIVSCTLCAFDKPVIIAPAMNEKMYKNPIVQNNISKLKECGYYFVGPVKGQLACGRQGEGHIAPVANIVELTESIFKKT